MPIKQYVQATIVTAIALLMSLGWLYIRNIYDDEIISFYFISKHLSEIWTLANHGDIHPPGMYILSKISYMLIPSDRWVTMIPLFCLYSGLLIFILRYIHMFEKGNVKLVFALMCTMHPHIFMWGNSIRWYDYWTLLGLIALSVSLIPNSEKHNNSPTVVQCACLTMCLTAMFYINYITLIFIFALAIAFLIRYQFNTRTLMKITFVVVIFAISIIPQLIPFMSVHLKGSALQKSSIIVSLFRLSHGVFIGEALVPWHPIAAIIALLIMIPMLLFLIRSTLMYINRYGIITLCFQENPLWISLMVFFVVFFVLGSMSGLGGKPRSFLLLVPIWGFLFAYGLSRTTSRYIKYVSIFLILIWIGCGYKNLIMREGTAKGGINDHMEEVEAVLENACIGKRTLIFSHDLGLTYYINKHKGNQDWIVCFAYPEYFHNLYDCSIPVNYRPEVLFVVGSYVGALESKAEELQRLVNMFKSQCTNLKEFRVCIDKDVQMKKKIPWIREQAKLLPDYRYTITLGEPSDPNFDWTGLSTKVNQFSKVSEK
jgi:hypothetical protein